VRLDLELPSDQRRLADPEAFVDYHRHTLVCFDEIQRAPGPGAAVLPLRETDRLGAANP